MEGGDAVTAMRDTPIDGGHALIVQHCCVYGRMEMQVRKFMVKPPAPYAKHDTAVLVLFARPRRRNTAWFNVVPDNEAAQYCGLDPGYFRDQIKEGRGPSYVKPSERRVFFTRELLDRWMASWCRSDEPIQPVGRRRPVDRRGYAPLRGQQCTA